MPKLLRLYSSSFNKSPYLTLLFTNAILMSLGDISAQSLSHFSSPELLSEGWDAARTFRFATYGAAMGPLGGKWFQYLDTRFPLPTPKIKSSSPLVNSIPKSRFEELKSDESPIPGMKLPKGSRLERGSGGVGGVGGVRGSGIGEKMKSDSSGSSSDSSMSERKASLIALSKRVAADQLGMAPIALFIFLFSMAVLEGLDHDQAYQKIADNYFPILFVNWSVWPILQSINFYFVPLAYRIPFGSVCGIAWTAYLSTQTSVEVAPELVTPIVAI